MVLCVCSFLCFSGSLMISEISFVISWCVEECWWSQKFVILFIPGEFRLFVRFGVFIISSIVISSQFVVHQFYKYLMVSHASIYHSKYFHFWIVGFPEHLLSLFLFLDCFEIFCLPLFVFHIFGYAGPFVGFFVSVFLLLPGSYQLMLSHIFFLVFLFCVSCRDYLGRSGLGLSRFW